MDKSLLTRATSKEDTPTPGYLYGEIARMTQHSFETSNKVLEFLISRVKNKHHNIKFKALQVIKHVCREGRVDFKRETQKHVPIIKECLRKSCSKSLHIYTIECRMISRILPQCILLYP
jgi:hypothetical protein